jgi:hypothetical protein
MIKKNPTILELDTELNAFSKNEKHADANMMILAILSHGGNGEVTFFSSSSSSNPFSNHPFSTITSICQFLVLRPVLKSISS